MSKNILLTGGTGFVGTHLTDTLIALGNRVSILSRSANSDTDHVKFYRWNPSENYVDPEAVANADIIIHLAGEGIANKRWTAKRKKALVKSRTQPLDVLRKEIVKQNKRIDVLISASAVGYYGAITTDKICNEDDLPHNDFLSQICQKWEEAADQYGSISTRVVKIRTGIVLGNNGGFLTKVSPPYKIGFGVILGSGKQFVPWIHIEDLLAIYTKAISDQNMNGTYNAAILDGTNFEQMAKSLASVYNTKIWIPRIPSSLLKLVLGEMSSTVTAGQRVDNSKLKKIGFLFKHISLEKTLRGIL